MSVIQFLGCANNKVPEDDKDVPAEVRKSGNETEVGIYRSGDSMLAAFMRKDWINFVRYNNPSLVNRMGGPEAFASFIARQMSGIPDSAVKNIALGDVLQVIKTTNDQQCVVEQNMQMIMEGVDLSRKTYLIGESLDNGKTWTFFDASTKTGLTPKQIKPNLSDDLKIPVIANGQE